MIPGNDDAIRSCAAIASAISDVVSEGHSVFRAEEERARLERERREAEEQARREAEEQDVMRWGLVPFWAKDIKVGFANINAKAEGIETKPAFREAFRRRRCLVPVDSFYEWKKTAAGKQPYAIALKGGGLMALAEIWENWRSPAGERVRSFAIITTQPNELCAQLHNRMPAILAPEAWPAWVGEESTDLPHLRALLAPYPADGMILLAGQRARRQCPRTTIRR